MPNTVFLVFIIGGIILFRVVLGWAMVRSENKPATAQRPALRNRRRLPPPRRQSRPPAVPTARRVYEVPVVQIGGGYSNSSSNSYVVNVVTDFDNSAYYHSGHGGGYTGGYTGGYGYGYGGYSDSGGGGGGGDSGGGGGGGGGGDSGGGGGGCGD